MAPEALLESLVFVSPKPRQELPDMFDLPSEYPEEPGLPDYFHYLQPHLLDETFQASIQTFSCGDMCIYYDPENPRRYRRPDWFAVLGVGPRYQGHMRKSYVVWQEQVRPFIIVELLSVSTIDEDMGLKEQGPRKPPTKMHIYRDQLQTPYYILFDGEEVRNTSAYRWEEGRYRLLDCVIDDQVRIPIPEIDLELRSWVGPVNHHEYCWLRWYTADGDFIPTPEEEVRQLRDQTESLRAQTESLRDQNARDQKEMTRLRDLLRQSGIDPDTID